MDEMKRKAGLFRSQSWSARSKIIQLWH